MRRLSSSLNPTNLILIGMPGAGKSTVGAALAKLSGRTLVDTDKLIETQEKRSLQAIVDADGYLVLRAIEEKILLGIHCKNAVIATGGSAVYSDVAMAHLKQLGKVIYLQADLPTIESRISNLATRGIARRPDQSFSDVFQERAHLYDAHADMVVSVLGKNPAQIAANIINGRIDSKTE
jgi:shikimate kinase